MTTINPHRDNSDNNNNTSPYSKKITIKPDRCYNKPNPRPELDKVADDQGSILSDQILGNTYSPADNKLLEEWRRNAEYGSHYASTPIEDEGKYFEEQAKLYDNPLKKYSYHSSDALIPNVIVGREEAYQ